MARSMADHFDVVVVGSLHLDIMVKGPHLPALDETVMGSAWGFKCGGKGGNQAVAAAKAGASTCFVGRVGDDDFGRRLVAHLNGNGVEHSRVAVDPTAGSGMSVAIEDAGGGYGAVVVSGANQRIAPEQFAGLAAKVLLLQNEVAPSINLAAARAMKRAGAMVVHNTAPFVAAGGELLPLTDVIVANRVEAEALSGESNMAKAVSAIAAKAAAAIVTCGGDGCYVAEGQGPPVHIPANKVKVMSTHGAGDCFCGTLAAALARGRPLTEAAKIASAAAAKLVSGG